MNTPVIKAMLIAVLLIFSGLTAWGIYTAGGILAMVLQHLSGPIGWQIFSDLVIMIGLFVVWMWHDAKRLGRNFWFWAIFAFTCGSFGPLLYLITRKNAKDAW